MTGAAARTVSLTKDPAGKPAVDLTKVREQDADLAKLADKAGLALSKRDLLGIRLQVLFLLDYSGSMRPDYNSGAVKKLITRALGFALQVDADGKIPVIPFDTSVRATYEVTQANFATAVDDIVTANGMMGGTDLAAALRAAKEIVKKSPDPVLIVVATDDDNGNDKNKAAIKAEVVDLANYPAFIKFLALREVPFLSDLDDLDETQRLVDNVDAKPEFGSSLDLLTCSDSEFQDALADELNTWIDAAKAAGLLQ